MIKNFLVVLISLTLFGCNKKMTDWAMYQNDVQRTSVTKAPPVNQPKILWKTEVGIQGYLNNSVVIGNKVYVGSSGMLHNKSDRKDGIYCLNAGTGEVIWKVKTSEDACGVAYSAGKLLTTGDDGFLRCLDANSGKEVWKIKRNGPIYAQPLVISKNVYIGDESGKIVAVEIESGEIIWENQLAGSNIRGGLSSDGKKIFGAFVDGTVAAVDQNGKTLWKTECKRTVFGSSNQVNAEIYATPTVTGDKLIVPFTRKTYYDYPAVKAFDKNTGELIWEATDKIGGTSHGNIRSSVAVWNDLLLYGNPYSNKLIALNSNDGQVAWSTEMGVATWPHWPSPSIATNTAYLGRNDGGFYAINLETHELIWSLYLGKSSDAGDMKNVEGKDLGDWKPAYGESIYATPSISKTGIIFIGSGEGWMYAIGE